MTIKNLKRSWLLLLANLLVDTGELLKDHFGYSDRKPAKQPPEHIDESSEAVTEEPPASLKDEPNVALDTRLVDDKGVPFNQTFCGSAKIPFYGSGARKGQWKKKKGVTDEKYNTWYMRALSMVSTRTDSTAEPDNIAAGQFGAPAQDTSTVPETLGDFMAWVAEQHTVGKITPEAVHAAYATTGVTFAQVNDPTTAKTAIKALWDCLNTTT